MLAVHEQAAFVLHIDGERAAFRTNDVGIRSHRESARRGGLGQFDGPVADDQRSLTRDRVRVFPHAKGHAPVALPRSRRHDGDPACLRGCRPRALSRSAYRRRTCPAVCSEGRRGRGHRHLAPLNDTRTGRARHTGTAATHSTHRRQCACDRRECPRSHAANASTTVANFLRFATSAASREVRMPRPSVVTSVRFLFACGRLEAAAFPCRPGPPSEGLARSRGRCRTAKRPFHRWRTRENSRGMFLGYRLYAAWPLNPSSCSGALTSGGANSGMRRTVRVSGCIWAARWSSTGRSAAMRAGSRM